MLSLVLAAVGVAVTIGLAAAAVYLDALTFWAGVVAATFGIVIVLAGGFAFLALLVLFVVGSVLATRYGYEEKRRANVQEGTHGERGVSNVLAHIVLPTTIVLVALADPAGLARSAAVLLFTSALAFGTADTFASEFGVLAGKARSILTLQPVKAGTNGGVSGVGELWAFVGALSTSVLAILLFVGFETPIPPPAVLLLGSTFAGFAACQVDSVLGEGLENRGWLSKGSTNFLAMLSSVALGAVVLLATGNAG